MKKEKVLAILMVAAMGISLTACGGDTKSSDADSANSASSSADAQSSTSSADSSSSTSDTAEGSEELTIAWVDGNLANESNAVCSDAAEAYAKEQGVNFILLDGQGSGEEQVSHCETLIAQGDVDCVIVQPYDASVCQVGVQACIDAGIPVLVTKTTIEDNSICPFVGQDDTVAGEMEMEWMAEQLGGKGNIVVIEGPTGISAAIQRNDGINNVLAEYPDIKVVYTQTGNWNRMKEVSLMETWLQTGEQIDGVVAHNDEMALGAYDALADAGLAGQIPVIGIDGIDAVKESVEAGELNATILQDVETIGQKTVEVAIAMAKGEEVEDVYNVDPVLLTKDNIADYM